MGAKICFTVKIKAEVDCFKVPDEERKAPSICANGISSPSDRCERVDIHHIGSGGSSAGGKYHAYPPIPLSEHGYPGWHQGTL